MQTSKIKFKVGDVVKCHDDEGARGIEEGKEYEVTSLDECGDPKLSGTEFSAHYHRSRFTLVRRAASPAAEGWREVGAQRGSDGVYLVLWQRGNEFWAMSPGQGHPGDVRGNDLRNYTDQGFVLNEPAPAALPDGKAGKEVPARSCVYAEHSVTSFDHSTMRCNGCGALARDIGFDVYAIHRHWEGNVSTHALPANVEARKRNIAALAQELSEPSAQRRAQVSRFDGGPWQEWPKGCERNEV